LSHRSHRSHRSHLSYQSYASHLSYRSYYFLADRLRGWVVWPNCGTNV
jgi:hypothetical protein